MGKIIFAGNSYFIGKINFYEKYYFIGLNYIILS
jgi:hypothetical protein